MKKYFLSFVLLLTTLHCSQTNKSQLNMAQNSGINSKNIINEVITRVKHYPQEPRYMITFTINDCNVLIYINDIIAYKYLDGDGGSSGEEINPFLLPNKNQKLKIVCIPVNEKFLNNSYVNIEIISFDNLKKFSNDDGRVDNIFKYSNKGKIAINTPQYNETVVFNLPNVPYVIDSWSESQDLRDFDKKILGERVLQAYKMIEKAFKEKDLDKIARFSYNKIKDQSVSQYFDKEEVQEGWDELASIAGAENLEFFPLEDYELVFYGDGKLVGLKSNKKEKGFRGASALLCKFKKEGSWTGAELDYLLHIPKGKTEFEIY